MLTEQMENSEKKFIEIIDKEVTNLDIQSHSVLEDSDAVLNIKTNLLKQEEAKKFGNRFLDEVTYEKSGSNGIFESLPRIVKIKGFELNKKCSVKIQVINKSKFSQRISILPPTTPFFKIKFSRKGIIAPGLAEIIVLSFTPQNYVYYYDYIRVFTEGDKMIIPIHAFPKMNIHMKEYVPKYIDFGTVPIQTEEYKEIVLKNIIDKAFEFELVPVKLCEQITIDTLYGSVEGFTNRRISIKFTPSNYGIFQSEYEFRLSEMEFKPVLITISGACNLYNRVLNENIIKHMKKLKDPDGTISSLDLSFNKKIKNTKITLEDVAELHLENDSFMPIEENQNVGELEHLESSNEKNKHSKTKISSPNKTLKSATDSQSPQKGISKKFKNFPSNKEREFLNYFNSVDGVINDKEIKYIKFIGKKLLSEEQTNKIINERIKEYESNLMIKRNIDINRHNFEVDTEKCEVDRKIDYIIKPTFNFNQNDKFFKTRHYFSLFLKNMTKVLVENRASSRLSKIKTMVSKNNIRTPEDFGEFVNKDWVDLFNKDSEGGDDNNLKLKFLAPKAITRGEVYQAYDYNIDTLKQVISHENNINLEELKDLQYLERTELEVIGYKEFKSTGMTLYEISTQEKILRSCGENEHVIRGERGDSELAFDKVLHLAEMSDTYSKHVETKIDTLLFNNPSFKKYASYTSYPETGIEYNLQPRSLIDNTNRYQSQELQGESNYYYELNSRLPLSIYENIKIREIDNSNMIGDKSLDFLPNKLDIADDRDYYVKRGEKLDEDNFVFELLKEDENKLISEFEKDDEVIRNAREINKDEIYNFKIKEKVILENYLQTQKRKWMSTLPTVLEFYNSGVQNPNNKFII